VLPNFTTSTPGPYFSRTQLLFAAGASLAIYVAFVVVQNVRHRDFFLPPDDVDERGEESHAPCPSNRAALTSALLLVASLVAVVGLGKVERPLIADAVARAGLPAAVIAVTIAVLVLLPESISALKAARRGRIQTGLNLAYGSTMASIGLTIPVIAVVALAWDQPLALGLDAKGIVLLALTVITSALTVVPGRATMLQGVVHLAVFGAFLVFAFNP
jgi:Ca2+:H+ antiporter